MLYREVIMAELWRRLASVTGVAWTARNPSAPPVAANLPAIQIFELEDEVHDYGRRGGWPQYKRSLTVVVEVFVQGSSEGAASKELFTFLGLVKKALYQGGSSLNGLGEIREISTSRLLRPPAGGNVVGVGLYLQISYVEDTAALA